MEVMPNRRFKNTVKYLRVFLFVFLIGVGITLLLYIGTLLYAKLLGPPPLTIGQSSLYYANDGTLIGESHNGQKRYWVSLDNIAPDLVDATIAVEDKSFYKHSGFDYKRIAGAILADLKAMAKVQGASTISQQYARNLFLSHEKTWKRKLNEAFYTIRIEMNYTKDQILEGYLNTIYYGKGAYGVEAASQFYFGKKASELSLAEASMLAGIPKGPNIYSPLVSYEQAKKRQKIVLSLLVQNKMISKEEAEKAVAENIKLTGNHSVKAMEIAPYFQDTVRRALKNVLQLNDRDIELGGFKVYTTLNLKQQQLAEEKIKQYISKESDIQVGFVAMNPTNGHIEAMVGGRNYQESPFNRATQAIRHPGSTLKPLLYYSAIEKGFTPSTLMRSELTTFTFEENRPEYTPQNHNQQYANKEITMLQALALSDNVYAVKTHLFLGTEDLVQTANKFGITTKMDDVPSLALGTSGVRVIEMANAYSLFANSGKKVSPVLITRVENYQGKTIYEYEQVQETVLQPDVAFVTAHMMSGMFERKLNGYASVTGNTIIKEITRIYAGKSGSTDSDSWMIGFTPQLVTAVWTGYDYGEPIESTAEKLYAKNIWVHFMEDALHDQPIKAFKPTKDTVGVYINPENGKLATSNCPVQRLTYYRTGTEPTEYCTEHSHQNEGQESHPPAKEPIPWYKKLFKWGKS